MGNISVRTLTPIWTGGVNGKCTRIHETGILGSLRWWYETLVRGAGGWARDHDQEACIFDPDKFEKAKGDERKRLIEAGLCDVCQVFGATGWRRRFSLTIDSQAMHTDPEFLPGPNGKMKIEVPGTRNGWYIGGGLVGTADFRFSGEQAELAADLLRFAARKAGIGAQTQLGFGVVRLLGSEVSSGKLLEKLGGLAGYSPQPDLLTIQRLYFARLLTEGRREIEIPFELKHNLRLAFRGAGETNLRHDLMGKVYERRAPGREDRYGSMVSVSRPYRGPDGWEIRLWGWAPARYWPLAAERIKNTIQGQPNLNLIEWDQYQSDRDGSPLDFFSALG